ncbi:fucose-specific lectin [Lasiosphaeria miniovina]|uniref:Fucose-specific lectin n=1 Tax=Lasiosphaeria miniovina TaxID=1954250 RepID=A0AA40ADC4_9PEZI|nr:fucose-specific lectin [Lasiosphaeria miniovina]KAK0713649.1 fucose-specific lectin [Lasiosphaeria miniovina]
MSAVTEILIRTGLAAVRKDAHIRVYETAVDGGIREVQYEGGWGGGKANNTIAVGKIGTPVAATSLGLENIRVYYIGADNKLKEHAYDAGKGWYNGNLSSAGFDVAPYSGVSAVFLGGRAVLRVYAQIANNTIQEYVCINGKGWSQGSNLGAALPGTQIAATSWGTSSIHIRVYFQGTNLNVVERGWDGSGWYTGGLSFSSKVVRTALGVTSWGDSGSGLGIRLYYGAADNYIKEKAWDGNGGWYDGGFSQPTIPASNVAAIPLDILRVYLQNGTDGTAVTEFAWGNSGWVSGYKALPPA